MRNFVPVLALVAAATATNMGAMDEAQTCAVCLTSPYCENASLTTTDENPLVQLSLQHRRRCLPLLGQGP